MISCGKRCALTLYYSHFKHIFYNIHYSIALKSHSALARNGTRRELVACQYCNKISPELWKSLENMIKLISPKLNTPVTNSPVYLPQMFPKQPNWPQKVKNVKLTLISNAAIFTCKQTTLVPNHTISLTGAGEGLEKSKVMTSKVMKCLWIFFVLRLIFLQTIHK